MENAGACIALRTGVKEQSQNKHPVLLQREITTLCVSEGLCFCVLRRVAVNPSLTLRVVINPSVASQMNNLSAGTRNFKTDTSS